MFTVRLTVGIEREPDGFWSAKLLDASGVGRAEMLRLTGKVRAGTRRNALVYMLQCLCFEVSRPKKAGGRPPRRRL